MGGKRNALDDRPLLQTVSENFPEISHCRKGGYAFCVDPLRQLTTAVFRFPDCECVRGEFSRCQSKKIFPIDYHAETIYKTRVQRATDEYAAQELSWTASSWFSSRLPRNSFDRRARCTSAVRSLEVPVRLNVCGHNKKVQILRGWRGRDRPTDPQGDLRRFIDHGIRQCLDTFRVLCNQGRRQQ